MRLLNRLFGRGKRGSGATAKERLRFVLQHDRINLPPERMEEMKRDIVSVIVKYVVVDEEHVEIALQQLDRSHSKLVAEIPFTKQAPAPSQNNDAKPKPDKAPESSLPDETENGEDADDDQADAETDADKSGKDDKDK